MKRFSFFRPSRVLAVALGACGLIGPAMAASPEPGGAPVSDVAKPSAPRAHPFRVKHLLAAMGVQDIDALFSRLKAPEGQQYLEDLWGGVGLALPESERVAPDGLSVSPRLLNGQTASLLIELPAPTARNEAYYLVAMRSSSGAGVVFGLERAVHTVTGAPFTMLVAWTPEGRRNFGAGPDPSADAFLAAVERVLAARR